MSVEENKEMVRRLIETTDETFSEWDELVTEDFVTHSADGMNVGLEDIKKSSMYLLSAFPDIHMTIEDMVAEGDKVAVRLTSQGTHKGQFFNIAPTGKKHVIVWFSIFRIEEGRIAEEWSLIDWLSLYQQLGALPPTEEIGK